MLIGLIMMLLVFPAAIAAGYDLINKKHTEADVQSVWTAGMLVNSMLIIAYVMFFC